MTKIQDERCPACSADLDCQGRCPACWGDIFGRCDECHNILQEDGICEFRCIQFEETEERLCEYEGDSNSCYLVPATEEESKKMNPLELLIYNLGNYS